MESTDYELLSCYREGQADALAQLVDRYRRPLFSYILNMTPNMAEADEVFQEVWLRVIKKAHRYRKGSFFGWLVTIARNLIIDRGRRKRPSLVLDVESDKGSPLVDRLPAGTPNPAMSAQANELGNRIAEEVNTLPIEQKEVFLLRVQANVPFKEIARIQKTSINTALARMQYALHKLRRALKEDYVELTNPSENTKTGARETVAEGVAS
ncbi:MAG: sigma-70 family RNA polymerase sigma factor [Kiritimatiellia bacterium]|jgi:RNA polymerase sigma-70 factor (ECF subfamily)|nr:sigma-70 family RNA polymerase sigma factor [Kiritimatiellia bacterium]MDP6847390.1 sigma-70 family RNA polymerase sigma factor [Kiritimatiellia bacterium]